jgi:hypothetical protein
LLGDEQHHDLAQDHVPQQAPPTPALEVSEPDFALDPAEGVLDAPSTEGHPQQRLEGRVRRGVGDEVFDLAGREVPRATISQ